MIQGQAATGDTSAGKQGMNLAGTQNSIGSQNLVNVNPVNIQVVDPDY